MDKYGGHVLLFGLPLCRGRLGMVPVSVNHNNKGRCSADEDIEDGIFHPQLWTDHVDKNSKEE